MRFVTIQLDMLFVYFGYKTSICYNEVEIHTFAKRVSATE